jgi:hypothetical protein
MKNPYSADQYPDLSLAMTPPNVVSGEQQTSMPLPDNLARFEPAELQCDNPGMEINQMGISPGVPYFDLMLGNSPMLGDPDPYPKANNPTFTASMMAMPSVKDYDLQAPGIDQIPEYSPDPYTGDLLDFDRPKGLLELSVNQSNPLAGLIDPNLPNLADYDYPANLLMPSTMAVDPVLPDLQQPQLEQDVHMADRPSEMGMPDGSGPDLGPDGDNDDDDGPMPPYDDSFGEPGLSHRQKKQDMVYSGLKGDM